MNEAIKLAIEKGGYESNDELDAIFWKMGKVHPHKSFMQGSKNYSVSLHNFNMGCPDCVRNQTIHEIRQAMRNFNYRKKNSVALDPLFWQALGKALGKEKTKVYPDEHSELSWWLWAAHEYLDILLFNSDTEQFWKELLTPPSHAK